MLKPFSHDIPAMQFAWEMTAYPYPGGVAPPVSFASNMTVTPSL